VVDDRFVPWITNVRIYPNLSQIYPKSIKKKPYFGINRAMFGIYTWVITAD